MYNPLPQFDFKERRGHPAGTEGIPERQVELWHAINDMTRSVGTLQVQATAESPSPASGSNDDSAEATPANNVDQALRQVYEVWDDAAGGTGA